MAERQKSISPSQISESTCRLNWYWKYKKGYKPMRKCVALELGIGIHYALQKYYQDELDPVKTFKKWAKKRLKQMNLKWEDDINKMNDAITLGTGMLKGYYKAYSGNDDFEVLETEHTLSRFIPIPGSKTGKMSDCKLTVRLDGLVRDNRTHKLFSLEHKTFSRFSESLFDLDHQISAQVYAGQDLAKTLGTKEEVVGVIWNGLRKQLPGPKVKLALFERRKVYRNKHQLDFFLHQAYTVCEELNSEDLEIYPMPNPIRCGSCDFREPCIEYMKGGDYKFLLNNLYTKRDDAVKMEYVEDE
jgi:hypothetical protein